MGPVTRGVAEMRSHAMTPRPMKVIDVARSDIGQFLVVDGMHRCMLDQLRLGMRDSTNPQSEGESVDKERLHRHDLLG